MLIAGIVLFTVAVGLLVFATIKKRSVKPAMVLLPFAIVMIGFPSIQTVKIPGLELTKVADEVANDTAAVQNNSSDETAKSRLAASLQKIQSLVSTNDVSAADAETIARGHAALGRPDLALHWAEVSLKKSPTSVTAQNLLARERVAQLLPSDLDKPLSNQTRSELATAVNELSSRTNLSAEAHLTLSKAQLILKDTNAAAINLVKAMTANTNLVIDPNMKMLLKPSLLRIQP